LWVSYSAYPPLGCGWAVRLQAWGPSPADVTARLSDVEINTPLSAAVFDVKVPPDAEPLTIGELRRAGPLGNR
jgi:hypothetical protein